MTATLPRLGLAAAWLVLGAHGCAGPAAPAPASLPVGRLTVLEGRMASGGGYAGSAACRACHPGPWERWSHSAHAMPFAGLPERQRGEAACLRCHATGFGERSGYRPGAPAGLDAVGCEACHGPGRDHAASGWPALVVPALTGECAPCDANRVCRLCHTPERSPGFDLARDLAVVACGREAAGGTGAQP